MTVTVLSPRGPAPPYGSFAGKPASAPAPSGPMTGAIGATVLNSVPAKAFTRKNYQDEITKIREEAVAVATLLAELDDKQRADLAYENAKSQYEVDEALFFDTLTQGGHDKLTESKAKMDELRKARDHQYFMEIVNKEWEKYNKGKKKN